VQSSAKTVESEESALFSSAIFAQLPISLMPGTGCINHYARSCDIPIKKNYNNGRFYTKDALSVRTNLGKHL